MRHSAPHRDGVGEAAIAAGELNAPGGSRDEGEPPMQNAAELVTRAQQGDPTAFGELYEGYSPLEFRFLRRRVDGTDEIVEDLTEDLFVKVFEKLDRYVERGLPFTAWLYRIAHNHLVDYLRSRPRYTAHSLDDVAEVAERHAPAAY